MIDKEVIKKIIPHREPFLLIDEIIELVPGRRAVGYKNVREDEEYFKGHFPEFPVMPGVLILESLAQMGAVAALGSPEFKGKIAILTGADKVKFRKTVHPGDTLKLECELIKIKKNYGYAFGRATKNGELVCEAKISFAIK
ncbi:MAG: 3-hydroxyacyl-ACP dehydratase FabZ [Acholeplasma sp.]|nr:3-hydroxyacyl-ACP dehydratase FabZ [Acholeplasma sp.]